MKKIPLITLTCLIVLVNSFFVFAQGPDKEISDTLGGKHELSVLQEEARSYRIDGLELQNQGRLDEARTMYEKAIKLDPGYAVAYNDLGVIYESVGLFKEAEDYYLQAVKLDPNYAPGYSNLALFYEARGHNEQAAYYWKKRRDMGSGDDLWARKADEHLEKLTPPDVRAKREAAQITNEVKAEKSVLKADNKAKAGEYFKKAKARYEKGDEVTAFKMAIDAQMLDPSNKEITEFVDKVQLRLLSH